MDLEIWVMKDEEKTEAQLIKELGELRQRVAELEPSEAELKRVEEALRENEERFSTATKETGQLLYFFDPKTGKAKWLGAVEEITGYTHGEYQSFDADTRAEKIHPDDREMVLKAMDDAVKHGTGFDTEYRFRRKDSSYIFVEEHGSFALANKSTPYAAVGTISDITERKQAEEALRESEEKYRTLVEQLPIGIVTSVPDGSRPAYYNPKAVEMYGYEEDDIGRISPNDVYVDLKDREELIEHLNLDGFYEYEYWVKRKDGTPFLIRGRSVAVFDDDGQPIRYEGYMEDITEYRKMGQELIRLERLRSLGEMAAGFCHNFNNILTSVLGPALLLQRATDDPKVLREAKEILTGAKRARDLVQQLNRAVSSEPESTLSAVSINEGVHQTIQGTRSRWKDESEAQGITIEVATELEDVPSIGGTQSELDTIVQNLLFNAIEAMPEGGTITLQTQVAEDGVQLTVTDTGKGMDEETRMKVFEPFFTTKMDIGKGLGLTTVHGIITRWGGRIEVESTPGEGTTFTLRFPVWTEPEQRKEETAAETRQVRSGRVLIVEDDEGTCGLL